MKTIIERNYIKDFCCELQYRNYSESTIKSYKELLKKLEKWVNTPLNEITTNQLKDYLHYRITVDNVSVSTINQSISAFKILQTDIFGRQWEQFKIKRPRREVKIPVVLL